MAIARIKGETRAGDVLLRLRDDILNCNLKPGERLRFEALRDRYEVSFSTLREALSRLTAEQLVACEGQRGFLVAPVSIADLEDLTNCRVLLERETLRLSIARGDDAWEAGIVAAYHRMDRLQNRLGSRYHFDAEWVRLHGEFHLSLVSACGTPVLLEIRQKLFERAHRYRRMSSKFRTKWRPKDVEHKEIMAATLKRTPKALTLIERHIRETTANVIAFAGHLFREQTDTTPEPIRTRSRPQPAA